MDRRRLTTSLAFLLYVIQVGIILGLRLVSPPDLRYAGVALDVCAIVSWAAIDYAIMRYLFLALTKSEAAYATDLTEQLEQMLDAYRQGAEKEDELVRELGDELSEELSKAREALVAGAIDQLDAHLQSGLAITSKTPPPACDNIAVAAVIAQKERLCKAAGIRLDAHVALPEELPLSDVEIASIFFNLIDNAMHACTDLIAAGREAPTISVQARIQAGQLFIEVANPCEEGVDVGHASAVQRSRTEQRHGLGTQIIDYIASEYHGVCNFSQADGTFVAAVLIPMTR